MKRARHDLFFIKKKQYLQLGVKTCCLHNLKEKQLTTVFSYVSKEELSVIQLNSPFFLLVLHRSVLIFKKRSFTFFFLFFCFFYIRGRIYVAMCLLIIFGRVITNKSSNFTTSSGRHQRQTKEIANTF